MKFDPTNPDIIQAYVTAYMQIPELVLEDLGVLCGEGELSYQPGVDAETVAFREGMKNVLFHIRKRREKVRLLLPTEVNPT